ncbi:uncharacterized protein [Tursiops truncatus]|uniref:uncharacterized protein isoform X1 n=1 Tax=Tursiops truncatus TaxID=9739 RepID=UPI003CCF5BFC
MESTESLSGDWTGVETISFLSQLSQERSLGIRQQLPSGQDAARGAKEAAPAARATPQVHSGLEDTKAPQRGKAERKGLGDSMGGGFGVGRASPNPGAGKVTSEVKVEQVPLPSSPTRKHLCPPARNSWALSRGSARERLKSPGAAGTTVPLGCWGRRWAPREGAGERGGPSLRREGLRPWAPKDGAATTSEGPARVQAGPGRAPESPGPVSHSPRAAPKFFPLGCSRPLPPASLSLPPSLLLSASEKFGPGPPAGSPTLTRRGAEPKCPGAGAEGGGGRRR